MIIYTDVNSIIKFSLKGIQHMWTATFNKRNRIDIWMKHFKITQHIDELLKITELFLIISQVQLLHKQALHRMKYTNNFNANGVCFMILVNIYVFLIK